MIFSIIIPTRNRSSALRKALASCLGQTYGDFEVVVIDDASAEPARSVCEAFGDPRILSLRNETNLGASASRNRGLEVARGDYAVFLDSDDIYLPTKLEVLARTIETDAPDVILHRQYRVHHVGPDGLRYSVLPRQTIGQETIEEFTFRDGNYYNVNSLCMRTDIARGAMFRPELRMYEDQAFVFDCLRQSRNTVVLDDVLAVYVDDDRGSRASRRFRTARDYDAFQSYAERHLNRNGRMMIEAAVVSEISLLRNPRRVLKGIWNGFRAGVPAGRSLFYLFRSLFGPRAASAVLDAARSGGSDLSQPAWAPLLDREEVEA